MKIKFTLLLIIIFLTSRVFAKEVQHILFIGNSFTYRNHLPKMFGELAKRNGKQVDVQWNVRGKTSFYQHEGRPELFKAIRSKEWELSANCQRILALENNYINTIDQVILFLQGKLDTIAHLICSRSF